MEQPKKFPYLTDDQKNEIDNWFVGQGTNEECLKSIEANPYYFISKIHLTEDKEKRITGLCLLSTSKEQYCKDLFLGCFSKLIIKVDDLVIFLDKVKTMRGFGRTIRKAVNKWFRSKDPFKLDRLLSYNFGNTSWTNRDILCKFHIKPWNKQINAVLKKYSMK
jgi:hypothetical protein